MIITKTPYRISLFGGGTDYPAWFNENGGAVISFAIDKFCYISARELPPFFAHKFRVSYSIIELTSSIEEIKHPVVREAIRKFAANFSLEIQHHGDLPAMSGVGSSSAFSVGIINSLLNLKGESLDTKSLANEAINLEQNILKEVVGSQDQIACAVGGINLIEFQSNNNWKVLPFKISSERITEIEQRIVLLYSGTSRNSSEVSKGLVSNLPNNNFLMQKTMKLVHESAKLISSDSDLDIIGEMLNEGSEIKTELNPFSMTGDIEELLTSGRNAGALGGKVLGAGGGGFCMFWVKMGERDKFLKRMPNLVHVPIKISAEGTTVVSK